MYFEWGFLLTLQGRSHKVNDSTIGSQDSYMTWIHAKGKRVSTIRALQLIGMLEVLIQVLKKKSTVLSTILRYPGHWLISGQDQCKPNASTAQLCLGPLKRILIIISWGFPAIYCTIMHMLVLSLSMLSCWFYCFRLWNLLRNLRFLYRNLLLFW